MTKEEQEDLKKYRAQQAMFKKAVPADFNLFTIQDELQEMADACDEVTSLLEDHGEMETLAASLLGDEEEAMDVYMTALAMGEELYRLAADCQDDELAEDFDDLFTACRAGSFGGGYLGFDSYRGDFFPLDAGLEDAAEKAGERRFMRKTKAEMLDAANRCLRIFVRYMDVQSRYASMQYAFDILRGENARHFQAAQGICEAYEEMEAAGRYEDRRDAGNRLDALLAALPPEAWAW